MMLAVATNRTPVARHGMANNPLTPEQKRRAMGAAIKALRERAVRNGRKVSQDAAAEVMSITRQAWQLYEAGERQIVLQSDVQERIATALGFEHEDLLEEYRRITGEQPRRHKAAGVVLDARMLMQAGGAELPIRDTVQAGAWLPADDSGQVATTYPASRDGRYPNAEQWLSRVIGDSVNQLGIFDGDLVHCVSAIDIGYFPKTGDIVEVERVRFDGRERELSIKQVEVTPDGILLWPRSNNPRWTAPLDLTEGAELEEGLEVRIRALATGAIRRF